MDHIQIINDKIADLKLKYISTSDINAEVRYTVQFLILEELKKELENLEKKTEEKPEAVEFANWINAGEYAMSKNLFEWRSAFDKKEIFTSEELYERFKIWKAAGEVEAWE